MLKYLFCFFSCIIIISCTEKKQEVKTHKHQKIQSIEVINRIDLSSSGLKSFYYPRFSPDGLKVFFTSSNYGGLSYYDLTTNKIIFLNNLPGAGLDYCFSSDNSVVFFKSDTMQNRRRFYHIYRQHVESKNLYRLNKQAIRKVARLFLSGEDELLYWKDQQLMRIDKNSGESVSATTNQVQYCIQGDKLIVFESGAYKSYTPFPDQNLIWMEPVPASSDILIYVVGHGLYRFNPQENSSALIGDFRAARCSPDGRLLAYMCDVDDGHRVIGSDIFVATMDDQSTFTITDTNDEIEMYPEWAPDGRQFVFHTESGKIKLVNIKIN
jgi:dipeptidyl aminopeptidase/acylaminoacyl peptidase